MTTVKVGVTIGDQKDTNAQDKILLHLLLKLVFQTRTAALPHFPLLQKGDKNDKSVLLRIKITPLLSFFFFNDQQTGVPNP